MEKNGVAGRIETDYNAAGKATQMRTIGSDGKVQQKVEYEYLPGFYVAQQTDTTYWPNGHASKVTRHTYDESANFTGEFIQVFDQSGKQVAGHKLTHDPWTGAYRCSEWSAALQDYRSVDCPSGEEDHDQPEQLKAFTYDEVIKNLDAAREIARGEQNRKGGASHPIPNATQNDLAIILPAEVRPGERISGTIVDNAEQYKNLPEVAVSKIPLMLAPGGESSRLSVEIAGEEVQHADGPITFVVPASGSGLNITFRDDSNPARSVSQTVNFPHLANRNPARPNSFQAPALCVKGELCVVKGPFSGDGRKIFAAFEDRQAKVVAENSNAVYFAIPDLTEPGSRPLFIAEGSKLVALPVTIGKFFIRNNGRELQAGETLITFPTLDGPGDIPDAAWEAGNFPETNLERAQRLVPGFQPNQVDREHRAIEAEGKRDIEEDKEASEEKKKEEKKSEGEILLVIRNTTPEQISLRASKNGMLVFHLSDVAFQHGEFKYDLVVEAKKAGKIEVSGEVVPLLAPVVGQEFEIKSGQ